ncbi:type I-E CRISPR-associated protein Cas5/CasD [Streptomyces diastaticus]|uniref:type I-E CRISPR-associated protein Cas5/CasD n=1 Tax=Streptomyces diastaticus TaxID=1956 RepID=UPI003648F7BE
MTTPTHAPGILLRLTGPLQSWGENSHYNYRDTAAFPTRSGLIGLLAAALGRPRHHPLDDLTPLSVTVRADRPGKPMRDFQTVGGGLPRHLTVTTAEGGKRKENGATLITDRWYLTDAAFTVALTHHDATPLPPAWAHALAAPRWPLYLGRRSCPPEGPLLLGTSDHALHDLVHLPLALPTPRGLHLLIQSQHEPTLDRLPEHYATLTTRPLDALLDALQPGRTLHYRCVASPVRKPGAETRRLYQLPPVVALSGTAADEWWLRQTQTAGLTPTTHHSTPLDALRGQQPDKHGHRDHNRIRHARTRFDGTATITDPARLRHTILNGIGRAKAYGCGLLSITPAQDTA